jgi:hypothetical protein
MTELAGAVLVSLALYARGRSRQVRGAAPAPNEWRPPSCRPKQPKGRRAHDASKPSASPKPLTLGVELELQLVSTHDFDLDAAGRGPAARCSRTTQRHLGREARDHAQHDRDRHLDPAPGMRVLLAELQQTCATSSRAGRASSTSPSPAAARTLTSIGASSDLPGPNASTTSASCTATWPSSSPCSASMCTWAARTPTRALWLLHACRRYMCPISSRCRPRRLSCRAATPPSTRHA